MIGGGYDKSVNNPQQLSIRIVSGSAFAPGSLSRVGPAMPHTRRLLSEECEVLD